MFTRAIKSFQKNTIFSQLTRHSTNGKTKIQTNPSAIQSTNVSGSGHKVNANQKITFGSGFLAGAASTVVFGGVGFYAIHSHCKKNPDAEICKTAKEYIFKTR